MRNSTELWSGSHDEHPPPSQNQRSSATTPSQEMSNVASATEEIDMDKASLGDQPTAETANPLDAQKQPETFPRKLESPIFEGSNPNGWLIRA